MGFAIAHSVKSHLCELHCCVVGAAATMSVCTLAQHNALKAATCAVDEKSKRDASTNATGADVEATDPARS